MGKLIDETGNRYGRLVVLKQVESYKFSSGQTRTQWLCKCDCGEQLIVLSSNLRSGNTQSCGCRQIVDETGNKYGRLIVIGRADDYVNPSSGNIVAQWLCQCNCGNKTILRGTHLRDGSTQSCGCLQSDRVREENTIDELGNKYGSLVVIEKATNVSLRRRGTYWRCKCSCGEETIVKGTQFRYDPPQSCPKCANIRKGKANRTHGLSRTKEYKNAKTKERRELKRSLDSIWTPDMEICLFGLFDSCVVCGATKNLSVDHVRPLSKGFGLEPGNAIVLCRSCNTAKRDKLPKQLKPAIREKVFEAAEQFKRYWETQVSTS